jgi:formamidopyrimidine-DNA glycosylase
MEMPELPEILSRAYEMNQALPSKKIRSIEVLQPKCLNLSPEEFTAALTGASIEEVSCHGKWIKTRTSLGWLLLNLGMGGEILLTTRQQMPAKFRLVLDFADDTCLTVNFWWFGYAYFAALNSLNSVPMIARLGPNALDLSREEFHTLARSLTRSSRVKPFILDQSRIAGIGNAYIHDILFLAGLHPMRYLRSMTDAEVDRLFDAIHAGLEPSISKGGAFYESNLHGEKGGFSMQDILIGYKAGSPCPTCGTTIEKIRTGSTSSFICPDCQRIDETFQP